MARTPTVRAIRNALARTSVLLEIPNETIRVRRRIEVWIVRPHHQIRIEATKRDRSSRAPQTRIEIDGPDHRMIAILQDRVGRLTHSVFGNEEWSTSMRSRHGSPQYYSITARALGSISGSLSRTARRVWIHRSVSRARTHVQ